MTNIPRPPKSLIEAWDPLSDWCILHAHRGSVAHGTYIPDHLDDVDTMAICVPPCDFYYGLRSFGSRGTLDFTETADGIHWDVVVYEARKALQLLQGGNPNVLSLLWLDPGYYIHLTDAGRHLLNNRGLFVGKHVYNAFTGYAHGQLGRMEKGVYQGYMGKERKAMVDQIGYDTKHASHCIRLLRMGIEFLEQGKLFVHRGGIDADELLAIKRGEWTLVEVKRCAEDLFAQSKRMLEKSSLPNEPNRTAINLLCTEIVHSELKNRDFLWDWQKEK